MRLLVLTSCGVSVLNNVCSDGKWLRDRANLRELTPADHNRLDSLTSECRTKLQDPARRRELSAELNGIAAVLERWPSEDVTHLLLHTDTALGEQAAELVGECLSGQVQFITAPGLRTDDPASFRAALGELAKLLEDWSGYREQGYRCIYHLSGGFKSVNAYLQALGMFNADVCVFLFEASEHLMEIPRLPTRLAEDEVIEEHLETFRRLAVQYPVTAQKCRPIPESLWDEIDEGAALNVWGDLVWSRVRKRLQATELHAPLSSKLRISEPVRSAFTKLPTDRRVELNVALDRFCAYLDGYRLALKSESFKKLQGKPSPPSTHELYLWHDGGAWRLLGHYEGQIFVADTVGPHL